MSLRHTTQRKDGRVHICRQLSPDRETTRPGAVRSLGFGKQLLAIETAVPEGSIAPVVIGRQKFRTI
jgi:hypothetical protein